MMTGAVRMCSSHADSKWTAMEETLGWRHFRVTQKRKVASASGGSGLTFLLMTASCDESAKVW